MGRYLLIAALLMLSATVAAHGQSCIPSQAMVIVGQPAIVNFHWPSDGSQYYLEVYGMGKPLYSKPISGSTFAMALPPSDYRWQVRKFYQGRYVEVMDFISFSVRSDLRYSFDGKKGSPGGSGESGACGWSSNRGGWQNAGAGAPGYGGSAGEKGGDVSLSLREAGEYVAVTITSRDFSSQFFLAKSSKPLIISARGGEGGAGGPGGAGGTMQQNSGAYEDPATTTRGYLIGGAGGAGGDGGDGGSGGDVTVTQSGGDLKSYVTIDNGGGLGGRGGSGGPGGNPGGQSGSPGRSGRDGQKGRTEYR